MSDPTTTNTLATVVNSALEAALTGGESAAEAALILDQPWLGLPIVKQLLEWLLDKIEAPIYANAAAVATKLIIDLQVNSETSAANTAFQNAQSAIATGDPGEISKAQTDLDNAFASLGHYDGSATV